MDTLSYQCLEFLRDHQLYHSEFQMDHFITLRSGVTVYGCYKQALRELFKRQRGLEQLGYQRERLLIDIDELSCRTSRWFRSRFHRERAAVDLREKRSALPDLDRNIEDTRRELVHFLKQAQQLKSQIGELDDEKRRVLDTDMWIIKIKSMAAMDLMTCGALRSGTVDMIISIPCGWRKALIEAIQDRPALIDWLMSYEPKALDGCCNLDEHGLAEGSSRSRVNGTRTARSISAVTSASATR